MSGFSALHIYPNKFFKPFYGEKNTRKYMEMKKLWNIILISNCKIWEKLQNCRTHGLLLKKVNKPREPTSRKWYWDNFNAYISASLTCFCWIFRAGYLKEQELAWSFDATWLCSSYNYISKWSSFGFRTVPNSQSINQNIYLDTVRIKAK